MTWQWTGYNAIIYLAGLQAIPTELYEAARMDGAGPVQIFFRITLPLLRPVILFTVVISTVTGLQTFTEPQVLFGSDASTSPNPGGPGQAGLTMVLYFYQQAFDTQRLRLRRRDRLGRLPGHRGVHRSSTGASCSAASGPRRG